MKDPNKKPAFYKHTLKPSEFWSVAVDYVKNKEYELHIENADSYKYPVDGWEYYEKPPEAYLQWFETNFSDDD